MIKYVILLIVEKKTFVSVEVIFIWLHAMFYSYTTTGMNFDMNILFISTHTHFYHVEYVFSVIHH